VPHEGHQPDHGFASYSPVTDGSNVWASFGSCGVYCFDVNGEHQWSQEFGRMTIKTMFGEGSSPALASNALIVVMVRDIYASPVGAAGRVYFVGRKGVAQVIRNAETFEILATNRLNDEFDASPAIAGNQLFLKRKRSFYCIGRTTRDPDK